MKETRGHCDVALSRPLPEPVRCKRGHRQPPGLWRQYLRPRREAPAKDLGHKTK